MQDILWLSVLLGYLCCILPRCHGSFIPTDPTADFCMYRNITMTDRNWQAALFYFRACRTLGLEMGDKMPSRYMSRLAKKLKYSNADFLDTTKFGRSKLKEVEREFNDLYKEISLLAANVNILNSAAKKGEGVTIGTGGTTDELGAMAGDEFSETSTHALLEEPHHEKTERPAEEVEQRGELKKSPLVVLHPGYDEDDDYGSLDLIEPASLFILLIVISIVVLIFTICTCRYVRSIHKYVELAPQGSK